MVRFGMPLFLTKSLCKKGQYRTCFCFSKLKSRVVQRTYVQHLDSKRNGSSLSEVSIGVVLVGFVFCSVVRVVRYGNCFEALCQAKSHRATYEPSGKR